MTDPDYEYFIAPDAWADMTDADKVGIIGTTGVTCEIAGRFPALVIDAGVVAIFTGRNLRESLRILHRIARLLAEHGVIEIPDTAEGA